MFGKSKILWKMGSNEFVDVVREIFVEIESLRNFREKWEDCKINTENFSEHSLFDA